MFLGSAGVAAAGATVSRFPAATLAWAEPSRVRAPGGPILLNSNENPYGTFSSVHAALSKAQAWCNRYPWHEVDDLVAALAARHKVAPEHIVLGNGSVDILRMAAEAFCGRGEPLVQASPTFEALAMYAKRRQVPVIAISLRSDFAHDLDAMLKPARGAGIVYICNPNNPTGSITPREDIENFLKKLGGSGPYVLLDEAYHHFADSPSYGSFADRASGYPRLIVTRTFSKVYGMAGLRLGYAITDKQTAERLYAFQVFDGPNGPALRAGIAALADTAGEEQAARRIVADREEFMTQAKARKLHVIPSQANFVMLETGRPVKEVITRFKSRDILIGRPFPPLNTYARISLGTPEEMKRFWQIWDNKELD